MNLNTLTFSINNQKTYINKNIEENTKMLSITYTPNSKWWLQ